MPERANLALAIYDATGKLVKTFSDNESWEAGRYSLVWDGTNNKGDIKPQPSGSDSMTSVKVIRSSLRKVEFEFNDETFLFSPLTVFLLCLFVGVAGGIYGIGGGSIVAPFFIAIMGLPVYTIAGAALMGTFVTSVASVIFYQVLASFYPSISVAPDWYLGGLFGIGGFAGIYLGTRCQKFMPAKIIKVILCGCVLFVAGKYIIGFLIKKMNSVL